MSNQDLIINTQTAANSCVVNVFSEGHLATPQITVTDVDFLGEATFPTGSVTVAGTQVGGLSGITYDASKGVYYSISDDRSQINPARFYTLNIDLTQGSLSSTEVDFTDVTTLLDAGGQPFARNTLDTEGISLTSSGSVFISSEGDVNASPQINPFVNEFSITGQQIEELPVPQKFLPTTSGSGIRNNLAFESLTITPDQKSLFTATENALQQDGSVATISNGSPARILQYDLLTGQAEQEFLYITEPVASPPNPPGGFSDNGLVELLALDNSGTLLSLERSFSAGVGNTIKLYEVRLQGATDISDIDSLPTDLNSIEPAQKRLVLDLTTLTDPSDPSKPLTLDNIEGMTFGPKLPNGRQSLVLVSDNNFSSTQTTQVLAFALDDDILFGGKDTTLSSSDHQVESWFAREAPGGNTIADLQLGADVIGIGSCSGLTGMGDFTQTGSDTLLSLLTDL